MSQTTNRTSASVDGLESGTEYEFSVAAVDESGNEGPQDTITVRTDYLEPAESWTSGFENGLGSWNVEDSGQTTTVSDQSYGGSQSIYTNRNNIDRLAWASPYGYPVRPSVFQYHYRETANSTGSGVRLFNQYGDPEFGTATDNPQYQIDDGDGLAESGGSPGYNRWIQVRHEFDWSAGTVDVYQTDTSTETTVENLGRPLKQGIDIETIEIWNQNGERWQSNTGLEVWHDDFAMSVDEPSIEAWDDDYWGAGAWGGSN